MLHAVDSDRYIPNDIPLNSMAIPNPRSELLASLERILDMMPPTSAAGAAPKSNRSVTARHCAGLYYGPTSIAYLFLVLSRLYSTSDLLVREKRPQEWCAEYLAIPKHPSALAKPDEDHCGVANEYLAQLAVTGALKKDYELARVFCGFARRLIVAPPPSSPALAAASSAPIQREISVDTSTLKEGSDEWLYGRAGYLYLLRLLRSSFPPNDEIQTLFKGIATFVIERILRSEERGPWRWHGKAYLGAVHGSMGIVTQILLTDASYAPRLEEEVRRLLGMQMASGNWPSSEESTSGDRLVQMCHGATGFTISLEAIRGFYSHLEPDINDVLRKARSNIWSRGLLRKDPNLCHGIAGNALGLGGWDGGKRFAHFVALMTRAKVEEGMRNGAFFESDEPLGLMTGEAGRAYVWAVVEKGVTMTCIGYNDI